MTPSKPLLPCAACPHRSESDLCDLDAAEALEFDHIRRILLYQPGQYVFYEGHAVLAFYVLCTGRIKLMRSTPRGRHRLVSFVDPGMLIERHTFQDEAVHEVTGQALEASQVCVIDRDRYLKLLAGNGDLGVRVIKLLSREMRRSLDEVDRFAFLSSRERLARLLLDLAARYGERGPGGCRITLALKREEIAQMSVMTLETAVRLLRSFQAARILDVSGRNITILRPEQLRRIARDSCPVLPSSTPPR